MCACVRVHVLCQRYVGDVVLSLCVRVCFSLSLFLLRLFLSLTMSRHENKESMPRAFLPSHHERHSQEQSFSEKSSLQ